MALHDASRRGGEPPPGGEVSAAAGDVAGGGLDLSAWLRAAAVPALHRRDRRDGRGAGQGGSHFAVTAGGVFVLEAGAWRWWQDAAGIRVEGAAAALAALLAHTEEVEEALAPVGLAPGEIRPVLVSPHAGDGVIEVGRAWLVGTGRLVEVLHARGSRLEAATQASVLERLAEVFWVPGADRRPQATSGAPAVAVSATAWRPRRLELNDLAAGGPVDDWMTTLHADQMQAVRRLQRGPALLRGGLGTGKTVVALHRAAYLAERHPGRVLVTTPVRALVGVLASQYRRLSPTTTERVEFATFHGLALRVLAERGIVCNVDPFGLDAAFRRAWDRLGGSGLGAWAPPEYWREEIGTVIKGRGIDRFDGYLRAPRPGRAVPLSGTRRRDVWELHLAFAEELARRELSDWYDVVRLARDALRERRPSPGYRSVIADEIGELPLIGIQLLHALVGDRPDGLLLVGECGCASELGPTGIKDAGVDVGGRSTVMRHQYRNAGLLLQAAVATVPAPGDEPELPFIVPDPSAQRDGKPVRHDVAPDRTLHDRHLIARLRSDLEDGVPAGDVAVLCHTDRAAMRYRRLLLREGLPVSGLERGPGSERAVKVGTVTAAQGQQFATVYLPAGEPLRALRAAEHSGEERRLRLTAMTAARDRLWVGTLDPAPA